MEDLIFNKSIKVKNNKTNESIPIDRYEIRQLRWVLRTHNVIIEVDYYYENKFLFTNEFIFEGKEEVDVNKLIEEVKIIHNA